MFPLSCRPTPGLEDSRHSGAPTATHPWRQDSGSWQQTRSRWCRSTTSMLRHMTTLLFLCIRALTSREPTQKAWLVRGTRSSTSALSPSSYCYTSNYINDRPVNGRSVCGNLLYAYGNAALICNIFSPRNCQASAPALEDNTCIAIVANSGQRSPINRLICAIRVSELYMYTDKPSAGVNFQWNLGKNQVIALHARSWEKAAKFPSFIEAVDWNGRVRFEKKLSQCMHARGARS